MSSAPPTILVTGGTGFLGAHLLHLLTSRGHHVRALHRKGSSLDHTRRIFHCYDNDTQELWERIQWHEGDLLDIHSLEEALEDISEVYHAAAVVSFQGTDQQTLVRTNVQGTANMVNACLAAKIRKLVYVSSIGTLGRAMQEQEVTEETQWNNKKTSVYSRSKYEAEREVWRGMAEGLQAVILNPSIILGPGNWSSGSPQLFQTLWKGLRFYTPGSNGFVCVRDVAELMTILMDSTVEGRRFIVSADNIPYQQLFTWMAASLGVKAPSIKAGRFLSGITWRVLELRRLLTGKRSSITRETAETANQHYRYSHKSIVEATGHQFQSLEQCIHWTAGCFLKDHGKK